MAAIHLCTAATSLNSKIQFICYNCHFSADWALFYASSHFTHTSALTTVWFSLCALWCWDFEVSENFFHRWKWRQIAWKIFSLLQSFPLISVSTKVFYCIVIEQCNMVLKSKFYISMHSSKVHPYIRTCPSMMSMILQTQKLRGRSVYFSKLNSRIQQFFFLTINFPFWSQWTWIMIQ